MSADYRRPDHTVSTTLHPVLKKRLIRQAEAEGLSLSALVRRILIAYLAGVREDRP